MFYVGDEDVRLAWFKITLKDVVGAIAAASSVLSDCGLDLKFGFFDTLERGVKGKYVAFVEMGDIHASEVVDRLRALDIVLDVECRETLKVIFQTADFPLTMLDSRAIITRAVTFVDVIRTLEEISERPEALLFRSGLKAGENASLYFMDKIESRGCEAVGNMIGVLIASGWGRPEVLMDETGHGVIYLEDSFIADVYGRANRPKCDFIAGYMAGFLTNALGVDVAVREVRCKAEGEDVCEFEVRPASQVPWSRSV